MTYSRMRPRTQFNSGGSKDDLDNVPTKGGYGCKDTEDTAYRFVTFGMRRIDAEIIYPSPKN